MNTAEIVAVSILVLVGANLFGIMLHGFFTSSDKSFEGRIHGSFDAVREMIEWPFRIKERRAEKFLNAVDAAVIVKLAHLSEAELTAIARTDIEKFERALGSARKLNSFAEAFKPLGRMFGEIAQMFNGIGDGIAAGVREAGGIPSGLTPERARLAAEIIRSEAVGEHETRNHRLSIKTDRVYDNFNPEECRRCAWLMTPGDDDDADEVREEATELFGPDVCTCGAEDEIQFPPHEPHCAKWNELTGNPR